MSSHKTVVLLGKLGHGKTRIINKICGTAFPSQMSSKSCTKNLQFGQTQKYKITVIDAPGFYSSEEIARHVEEQKYALEGTALSGIYIVVKYGRTDEMADTLNKVMDFVGDEDVRILITFTDIAYSQQGYDIGETRECLSELLDVPVCNIKGIGRDTDAEDIEEFIKATLHEPREFEVTKEQLAYMSGLSVGARKFNHALEEIYAKMEAAVKASRGLSKNGKTHVTDIAILATRNATLCMATESQEIIFDQARELTPEEQNLLRGRAKLSLLHRQEEFMNTIEYYLTSHADRARVFPALSVKFLPANPGWFVQYSMNDVTISLEDLPCKIKELIHTTTPARRQDRKKRAKKEVVCSQRKQRRPAHLTKETICSESSPLHGTAVCAATSRLHGSNSALNSDQSENWPRQEQVVNLGDGCKHSKARTDSENMAQDILAAENKKLPSMNVTAKTTSFASEPGSTTTCSASREHDSHPEKTLYASMKQRQVKAVDNDGHKCARFRLGNSKSETHDKVEDRERYVTACCKKLDFCSIF